MSRNTNSIWADRDKLYKVASSSNSISECLRVLDLNPNSGNRKMFKDYCLRYSIALPVWDYRGVGGSKSKLKLEDIFRSPSPERSGAWLKNIMIKDCGFSDICVECGLGPIWNDKPIVLQVDHIDGNRFNNLLDNLRILCPNCHTQTDTFSNKRKGAHPKETCSCGLKKARRSLTCRACSDLLKVGKTVIDYPEVCDILDLIDQTGSILGASKLIGVSDNGLRKHLKSKNVDV